MSRTGPGGGGPGRGGAAAPALGPGRPRGEPELCCPSGRSLGGGGRTATDPSLAFTGPSPARGRGAHPAGRAARRRFGQRWGEVEWTPGSDTFANRARTPRPEGLPGPGRGRPGGAGRPNTAPCSLRWGAAPLPLLTEGLAFFPSSSPLWSVTCHDPATCHSSARWESGERTALPTPRGAASPPRAAWLFCIPAGRGGQPRPGRQGRTVTRRPGQQGHLSSRACVFSGSVAIWGPQKQSSVCRAW